MQQGAADAGEVADHSKAGSQYTHRQPVQAVAYLDCCLTQGWQRGMFTGQGDQPICQCRQRPKQRIPEDHRKETLVSLPHQMPLYALEQLALFLSFQSQIAPRYQVRGLSILTAPAVAKRS